MPKAKVNRNVFIRLSVALKILYSRDRVVDMTGNLHFPLPYPAPAPSLATVTSVTNDLETKELAAAGGGPAQTQARDAALAVWNTTMRSVADYVDSIALGNAVIITCSSISFLKGCLSLCNCQRENRCRDEKNFFHLSVITNLPAQAGLSTAMVLFFALLSQCRNIFCLRSPEGSTTSNT